MKFRTEIAVRPFAPEERIGYANRILALGSCFASETASRLCRLRFRCTAHPTGILFNPASIADALEDYAAARPRRAANCTAPTACGTTSDSTAPSRARTPTRCSTP